VATKKRQSPNPQIRANATPRVFAIEDILLSKYYGDVLTSKLLNLTYFEKSMHTIKSVNNCVY